jgi:LmbE family N-acetylglucosaminyl deacetylase
MRRFVPAFVAALLALAPLAAPAGAQPAAPDLPDRPLVAMNLAGHPDDEDGLTMAYYRGNQDAAVYSVIFTRGEGGQNEAGPELYERLGAIRTAETERAARVLGTRVFYLNRYDFGYSKHAWETFTEWSRPRAGFWDTDAEPAGEAAGRDSLVADLVYLVRRLKPDVLFTNHDTTTGPSAQHGHHQAVGIAALDAFGLAADPTYRPGQLDASGVDLWQPKRLFVRVGGFSRGVPDAYDVAVPVGDRCAATTARPAEACADRAVAAASMHVSQGFDVFAPRFRRDTTYFQLLAAAPDAPPLPPGATDLAVGLAPNPHARALDLATRAETGRQPVTAVNAGDVRPARPGETPTLPTYRQQYASWTATPPAAYRETDAGVVLDRTETAPPVVVHLAPGPARLAPGRNEIGAGLDVYDDSADSVRVHVALLAPDLIDAVATAATTVPADVDTLALALDLPETVGPGRYRLRVSAATPAMDVPYTATRPAAVLPEAAVAPGLRVGFVRSYDGTTAEALRVMGAEVVELDSLDLATGDFDGLHTVVVDIRAYLDRTDLRAHTDRLLDWVERGGHLVVGYHKLFEWNEGRDNPLTGEPNGAYAPFPLRLGRDRVTMEDAPVEVLEPDHDVFRAPYEIRAADWDGWVQERGLYFPSAYDARYAELLATGDAGEAPLRSGLLFAEVGAGTYVYSPLVWYRQLDALNPGAWRLVANLASLPLVDGRAPAVGGR